jgi:predicted nucleic acid-binding protein
MPFRFGQSELVAAFRDTITTGENTLFISIDDAIAEKAGDLRARYGLSLTDTFQIAAALASGCDLFLTNDRDLKQVTEIEVLVLDDLDTRPE